jgi:hypothetical protein
MNLQSSEQEAFFTCVIPRWVSLRDWFSYTVTAGMFELKMYAHAQREAVLHTIDEWEAELMEPNVQNEPFHPRGATRISMLVTLDDDRGVATIT